MKTISKNFESRPDAAIRTALDTTGIRVTRQRALILEVIQRGQGHLDVDEIYRRARVKEHRLSLSTVYRTIQTLKKIGLVEEVHIDATRHHYETKQVADHYHLICLGCGRVIEFSYPLARHIKKTIPDAKDFDIVSTELRATGYCRRCRPE